MLKAGSAAAAGFDRKADDEDRGEAGADENGDGEDVHGVIGAGGGEGRIARLALDCAYSPQTWIFEWPVAATPTNLRVE